MTKMKINKDDIIWYSKEVGKGHKCEIDPSRLADWLKIQGFGLYHTSANNINLNDSDNIVRIHDGRIKRYTKEAVSKFIIRFYKDMPVKLFESIKQPLGLRKRIGSDVTFTKAEVTSRLVQNNIINNGILQLFHDYDEHKPKQFLDTKTHTYIPFQNKIVRISKNAIDTIGWKDKMGVIWEDSVRTRNIKFITDNVKGKFEDFVIKATSKRIDGVVKSDWRDEYVYDEEKLKSVMTHYGYLISSFKDSSKAVCVYFLDEEADNTSSEGGTGKSLVMESVKYFKKECMFMGKDNAQFSESNRFLFSNVDMEHKFIFIDDLHKNFPFERLYSHITSDMQLILKNKNGTRHISFDKSPKIGVTTNYVSTDTQTSTKRRQALVEFGSYWNRCYNEGENVSDDRHIGGMLFDSNWDEEEWNRFYDFGFRCVKMYLQQGFIKCSTKNFEMKQLIMKVEGTRDTGETLWIKEWIENDASINNNTMESSIGINELYDRFIKANPVVNYHNPNDYKKTFQKHLVTVANGIGARINPHTNGKTWTACRFQKGSNKEEHIYVQIDIENQRNKEGFQEKKVSVPTKNKTVLKHPNSSSKKDSNKTLDDYFPEETNTFGMLHTSMNNYSKVMKS